MTTTPTGLRIVSLEAENYKRLRAIEITPDPDGNLVVVAGRNAQGKTSALDAIWAALGGANANKATTRPIRDGEAKASVRVDLGSMIVTRTWTAAGTKLLVEAADGARYGSPQKMLDDLVGRLSFDPLAFTQQPEKEQLATLLDLVDLPFDPDELANRRAGIFEQRTEVNRDVKAAQARLDAMPVPGDEVPDTEVDTAALLTEYQRANETNAANAERRRQVADLEAALAEATAREADAQHALELAKAMVYQRRQELTAAEPAAVTALADVDTTDIQDRLAGADDLNRAVRARQTRTEVEADLATAAAQADELTARLAKIDEERRDGLAKAAMPIEGLGFDDSGVTYQGVPLKQASAAEQLRVSIAMAMALNPTVRVIRITDGSLLDSTNLALIESMAAAHDFQIWIERVDESGTVGVVIEDGMVMGETPAPADDFDLFAEAAAS